MRGCNNFQVTGVHIEHKIYEAPKTGKMYARKDGKWSLLDIYDKSEIQSLISTIPVYDDSNIRYLLESKVDSKFVYTKDEIDKKINSIPTYDAKPLVEQINKKLENIYTKIEVDNIKTTLQNSIENQHDAIIEYIQSNYYSKDDITTNIYDKQTIDQMLQDVEVDAYTKAEINSKLQTINQTIQSTKEQIVDSVYSKEQSDNRYQEKGLYLKEESDPTVPEWAKNPNKPSYTADEVGAIPLSMLESLGAGVSYTTEEEYDNLEEIQEDKFYICLENEEISKIYLGKFLIARKSLNPQSNGFPYTLPITF